MVKIKSETHPSGEDKAYTALPKPPLQIENHAKKRRVSMTHNQTYRGSGQKIRVQLRSRTSSPVKSLDKLREYSDGTDHAKSTAKRKDNISEGKRDEEDTD